MKALHAIALVLCASAPSAWIATLVLLVLNHDGSVLRWTTDDWVLSVAVLVVPIGLAAGLLRVPAPRRFQRTMLMLNDGVPSDDMRFSHSGR